MVQTGYTLPVFAVAAAKAAILCCQNPATAEPPASVSTNILPDTAEIPIEQVAKLDADTALAITRSDPGDNLDLTRNTPIWAWVQLQPRSNKPMILEGGEGIGKTSTGKAAIYRYARDIFDANILPLIPDDKTAVIRIILPEGRQLATRTSNEAFGILEGLSLLGTSGISQPLSAEDRLQDFRQHLQETIQKTRHLAFCIGSNGMQVSANLGISQAAMVQTGNWLGALLVEAGLRQAESVLLIGYHGKLAKLGGGIFNTSSHVADGKLEVLAATVVEVGGDLDAVKAVLQSQTAAAAYKELAKRHVADAVMAQLAAKITAKSLAYVQKYADTSVEVGTILFDRTGNILAKDDNAEKILQNHKDTKDTKSNETN
ncbi:cobalt-precorrin-5B (C(1))-methyltransferase CbiD [Geitlerinema sp. PCC 9228]|jgi:cobalt-precorrin-5B (C1)-methyltransferase|uniref:cobalt-precorrin-5B (C(1))-methyltransferase CbiD n=1 Tax=Geitlerinema sp. PCC 9228 TaxID=111611 RepID=UPI0008F9B78B|nr:cobalt-precorrin-5B (C(1))-methyltransferase CbiD [Geitlerinema sp. PCC 9228]